MIHTDTDTNTAPTSILILILIPTRLISIVSKPIKLICGQTNFDEKTDKINLGQKKALG